MTSQASAIVACVALAVLTTYAEAPQGRGGDPQGGRGGQRQAPSTSATPTTDVKKVIETMHISFRTGYIAPVHSHPYMEILHILDGTAEAWIDGQDDSKVTLEKGDTIALPPNVPHSFRVVGDQVLRLLGTHVSPKRIATYKDGRGTDAR